MELALMLLSHLPIVDLFANDLGQSTGGFIYDVGQAVAGLHALAKGIAWVSEKTPWEGDDAWGKKLLGMTTSAMEYVTRLGGALQKK